MFFLILFSVTYSTFVSIPFVFNVIVTIPLSNTRLIISFASSFLSNAAENKSCIVEKFLQTPSNWIANCSLCSLQLSAKRDKI